MQQQGIVFSAREAEDSEADIYVMNPNGTGLTRLTDGLEGTCGVLRISPDGTRIAFKVMKDGRRSIWWMYADGTGRRMILERVEKHGPNLYDWVDQDTLIYYSGPADGEGYLCTIGIDGGNDRRLEIDLPPDRRNPASPARISPDGSLLAVCSQRESEGYTAKVMVASMSQNDRGELQARITDESPVENAGEANTVWSRDSKILYWCREEAEGLEDVAHLYGIVCQPFDRVSDGSGVLSGPVRWLQSPYPFEMTLAAASPDNARLLGFTAGSLYTIDLPTEGTTGSELDTQEIRAGRRFVEILGADWGCLRYERIYFTARADGESESDIFSMSPDGGAVTNLTAGLDGSAFSPRMAPDGQRIAFLVYPASSKLVHLCTISPLGGEVEHYRECTLKAGRSVLLGWPASETVWATSGDRISVFDSANGKFRPGTSFRPLTALEFDLTRSVIDRRSGELASWAEVLGSVQATLSTGEEVLEPCALSPRGDKVLMTTPDAQEFVILQPTSGRQRRLSLPGLRLGGDADWGIITP
ncbi:MAG: hypothetical protein AB1486_26185 [Planctomycetota bacterium]